MAGYIFLPKQCSVTHGLPVLLFTEGPSGCPFVPVFRRDFPGRSVIQAGTVTLRIMYFFIWDRTEVFCLYEALLLSRWKNVSGILRLSVHRGLICNQVPLVQTSALLMRKPLGLNEPDTVSTKKPFPFPHLSSSPLSLTWYTKYTLYNDSCQ